ncbi:MAG: class I SAM-dependent methyltransferase [Candidatus Peregrinibacteria bacterium]
MKTRGSKILSREKRFRGFDQSYFTSHAYEDYTERASEEFNRKADRIIATIHPDPDWTFLDVGCGLAGGCIGPLRKRGFRAEGTDVSDYCLTHSPCREWIRFGEVLSLPFAAQSFDVIVCGETFLYVHERDIDAGVRELIRVAKHFIVFSLFDKSSPYASQQENPDPLRSEAISKLTRKDYEHAFLKRGCSITSRDIFNRIPYEEHCFSDVFSVPPSARSSAPNRP